MNLSKSRLQKVKLLNINMKLKFLQVVFFYALLITFNSCNTKPVEVVTYITSPTGLNSSESSLHKTADGTIYMSWIETGANNLSALKLSRLNDDNSWSEPKIIASGNDWFVNWADFPSLTSFGNNSLAAHYLQKSAPDTFAYDVMLSVSNDSGNSWSEGFKAHTDSTTSEHGFVSKVAINDTSFLSVWLDGRQTAYAEKDSTIAREMTLRAATFNDNGKQLEEYLLDTRVCDCCQTDTAMTENGPIVIYRDRSQDEIRDIYYVRQVNGQWTEPKALHHDNWKIEGCPVNGPAMSTKDNTVAIIWFSVANNLPSVKVIFSNSNGESFDTPIAIGDKDPMGRVDIELLDDKSALISWMDTIEGKTVIQIQRIYQDGKQSKITTLTEASDSRSSGFPRMVVKNNKAYLSWTNVGDKEILSVKTAIIDVAAMQ